MVWKGQKYAVKLATPGRFSVYNALGAAGACLQLGIAVEDVVAGLTENPGVSGRFQSVRSKKGALAVVDYAHSPDGLENVLNTANEFVKGKLIAVFGCGGDRDRTKRPIMGEIGGKLAGYCIITSDNPRTEDPAAILVDVEEGVKRTDCPYEKIVDRREAINRAVEMAGEGDVILIAGKGHENYQIFANETIHFDDMEEVQKAFGEDLV
jgi:UDP-N-acetylmuramoyl-L-alanyl-D-glutamate--2,6-diaminopimelate ligase